MSAPKEFLILRRDEPFLFGNSLEGVTWVHPLLFERPIEKIGSVFTLHWDGEIISSDKAHIVRVIAHWKKSLGKRARKRGLPLEAIVDVSELSEAERDELLQGIPSA